MGDPNANKNGPPPGYPTQEEFAAMTPEEQQAVRDQRAADMAANGQTPPSGGPPSGGPPSGGGNGNGPPPGMPTKEEFAAMTPEEQQAVRDQRAADMAANGQTPPSGGGNG